jgi:hypothetical protein
MTFQFDATSAGFEFDSQAIERWPVDAIGVAWEAYSGDIHACPWADMARAQNGWFLTYLYIRQLSPGIDFWTLSFGLKQFSAFAASKPWSVNASLPAWVSPDPPSTA